MSFFFLGVVLGLAGLAVLVGMAVFMERRFGAARPSMASHRVAAGVKVQAQAQIQARANATVQSQAQEFFGQAQRSPFDALAHLRAGDVSAARVALNKLAYMLHGDPSATPAHHAHFRHLLGLFGAIDPLVQSALPSLQNMVDKSPGLMQSKLFARLGLDAETGRFVLTCAEAMGKVVRRKKGNSYQVLLPYQDIEEVPAPKGRRARRRTEHTV